MTKSQFSLAWCLCRDLSTPGCGHRPGEHQPSERDLTGACRNRLVAVLSARSAGAAIGPCPEGRRPLPPSHTTSRAGSPSGSTLTARFMSPASWISLAATWPRPGLRPPPGAIAPCWSGRRVWVRCKPGALRGPAAMGLGWPGSWMVKVSWCWKSIDLTAPLAGGGASRTRSMPRPRLERSKPARQPRSPRPVTASWRWCAACGWPGHRGQGPHPGRQCPAGAGGHGAG